MNPILAFLQEAKPDFSINYILLGVLVILAVFLGVGVMKKKRQKEF
jgi:hypothetical protein